MLPAKNKWPKFLSIHLPFLEDFHKIFNIFCQENRGWHKKGSAEAPRDQKLGDHPRKAYEEVQAGINPDFQKMLRPTSLILEKERAFYILNFTRTGAPLQFPLEK